MLEHPSITKTRQYGYVEESEPRYCDTCNKKLYDGYFNELTYNIYCDIYCAELDHSELEVEGLLDSELLFYTDWRY